MSNPMPHQTFEPHPPVPPMPVYVPNPKRPKKRFLVPILVIGALLFGLATGAASTSAKEVEVIKEVPVEKIVEKEVTVEVPVTPQACLDVIDTAAKLIAVNIAVTDIMSDTLTAVSAQDVAAINANTEKVVAQNAVLDTLQAPWKEAIEGCRAG